MYQNPSGYLKGMQTRAQALQERVATQEAHLELLDDEGHRQLARDRRHLDNLLYLIRTYDPDRNTTHRPDTGC